MDTGGNGGNYRNAYGAWGEWYGGGMDYGWNGAWGYLASPRAFNFDANDVLDIGLYYVHGRWYNQDTGLWLSPDGNGLYIYFDNDPVNKHADVPPPSANSLSECIGGRGTLYNARELTCWLFREMKTNLSDPRLQAVKQTNTAANNRLMIGTAVTAIGVGLGNPLLIGAGVIGDLSAYNTYQSARKQFSDLVADRMPWDFKHKIEAYLGPGITLCSGQRCAGNIEFSVPGNVHFGFVAREAGYAPNIIHLGAGHAEITDPAHDPKSPYYKGPYAGQFGLPGFRSDRTPILNLGDDPEDNRAVEFGIRLYDKYAEGRSLTYLAFEQELGTWLIGFAKRAPRPRPVGESIADQWPYPLGFFDPTTPWLQ